MRRLILDTRFIYDNYASVNTIRQHVADYFYLRDIKDHLLLDKPANDRTQTRIPNH